jgi:hypothetical protein
MPNQAQQSDQNLCAFGAAATGANDRLREVCLPSSIPNLDGFVEQAAVFKGL